MPLHSNFLTSVIVLLAMLSEGLLKCDGDDGGEMRKEEKEDWRKVHEDIFEELKFLNQSFK